MKAAWFLLVVALAAGVERPAGAADDESIPKVLLRAAGQEQRGQVWTSTDSERVGPDLCQSGHGDGIPTPPRRGVELRRQPFRGRLVIFRNEEPRIRLAAYTKLDDGGTPEYDSHQEVRWRLRPSPSRAEPRRWVVGFRTPASDHVYLDLTASWRDPGGCGQDDASYTFHLARSD
jgi:hypothetical protein